MKRNFEKFKKYQGTIKLSGFVEQLATNNILAGKLTDAGFTNVVVTGSGATRSATGIWSKETQDAELPKQVTQINEV